MTNTKILSRMDTACAKLETLQKLAASSANRETREALADAKNATLRAIRAFERQTGHNI